VRYAVVAIALVTLLAGSCCSRQPDVAVHATGAMNVLRHPSGLALRVPEGSFDVKQTAAGFRLLPVGSAQRRTATEVTVDLRTGQAPEGSFPQTRKLRGRIFRYRVDVEEGGSGGDEHVLRAFSEAGAQHVWIEEGQTIEPPAKADFAAAWQIADGLEAP
jgi:hypothetical protein